eukprot:3568840-Pleurochrysis_carterae.AAC.1
MSKRDQHSKPLQRARLQRADEPTPRVARRRRCTKHAAAAGTTTVLLGLLNRLMALRAFNAHRQPVKQHPKYCRATLFCQRK